MATPPPAVLLSTRGLARREPTLNETLASLGYTTRPTHPGAGYPWASVKDILRGDEVVFSGDAGEVWDWLRGRGEVRS